MKKPILLATTLFLLLGMLLSACNTQPAAGINYAQIPAGKAYADGKEIYFVHTETSDPQIAEKLTNMMKSPVLTVPSLANVPQEALAQVYVFENGIAGKGPLGFQADVFNHPPSSEDYTPLRQIVLVKWAENAKARELKSEEDIKQAEANGELTLSPTNVVVNMPFVVWNGGKR